ncbi:MAG: hypothetical protein ABI435_02550 [Pseudolysinimonas sp.]
MNATTHPKRRILLTAVIGVFGLLLSLFGAVPVAQAAPTNSITGRILLEAGLTPATAGQFQVSARTVTGSATDFGQTTTASDGTFTVAGLEPGNYRIRAISTTVGDYPEVYSSMISFSGDGEVRASGDIIARPYRALSGTVRYANGTAVPAGSAQVTAHALGTGGPTVTVGAGGTYSFTGLVPATYWVDVDYLLDNSALDKTLVAVTGLQTASVGGFTIQLDHGYTVSGVVSLEGAGPVGAGEAGVVLFNTANGATVSTSTSSGGVYSFTGVVAGTYNVRVFHYVGGAYDPLYAESLTPVTLSGNVDQPAHDVTLSRDTAISGTVLVDGQVSVPTHVYLYPYDPDTDTYGAAVVTTTGSGGTYAFADLEPGIYELYFEPDNPLWAAEYWEDVSPYYQSDQITLEAGETFVANAAVSGSGSISGIVYADDFTAEDYENVYVEVLVYDYALGAWVLTGDTYSVDSSGQYNILSIYPDHYIIAAFYDGPLGYGSDFTDIIDVALGGGYQRNLFLDPSGAPVLLGLPTVTGTSPVGSTWTLDSGAWSGVPTPTITRTWLRCTAPISTAFFALPSGCTAIAGATGVSYVSTATDAGKYITAMVTATNSSGTVTVGAVNAVAVTSLPQATVAPRVSGSPAVGSELSSVKGTWTGSPVPTVSRVWLRCTSSVAAVFTSIPASCTPIAGATGATYVATNADAGKYLTIFVTATNSAGTTTLGAVSTAVVPVPATSAPALLTVPNVTGTPAVGSTLNSNRGTWSGVPTPTVTRVWLRCDQPVTAVFTNIPAFCTPIAGATAATYTVTSADAGKYLTIFATATNSIGTVTAGAISTAIVPFAPVSTVAPAITGSVVLGATLTVGNGSWTGAPTPTYSRVWLRCTAPIAATFSTTPAACVVIAGATGTTYVATSADVGLYLTALVTATNSVGSTKAGAFSTAAVASLPQVTAAPKVSGTPTVGSGLSSVKGTWIGTPTPTVTRVWLRCSSPVTAVVTSLPAGCTAIAGATGATYVVGYADAGKYLTVFVTATNTAGTVTSGAVSTALIPVPATSPPALLTVPKVTGTPTVGSQLSSNRGTWSGAPTPTVTRAWLRCISPVTAVFTTIPADCTAISGATGATYIVTAADQGNYLTIFATATNTAGTVTSGAVSTAVIP